MARKSVVKFSYITNFFSNETKLIGRGENAVESGHIASFCYDADSQFLKGIVFASMKDKKYTVEVLLKENGDIHLARCECPKGLAKCHHMAALLIHAHYNVSITDKQCVWSQRKDGPKDEKVKSVDELFPSKKFKAVENIPDNLRATTFQMLQEKKAIVGFTWLLAPEATVTEQPILPTPRDILYSKEYENSLDKAQFFSSNMRLTPGQISETVGKTKGQAANCLWSILRNDRLTASNFGAVINACRRNSFPPSLFKKLFSAYNLDRVKAVQWGKLHEVDGATYFETATNLQTSETGLWLHSSGVLGASPDRIVTFSDGSIGIIEVKCPFKFRNEMLSDALSKDRKYVIFKDNNEFKLNCDHDIYHQVQGQMYIVNCKRGFLVLWTSKDSLVFEIPRDDTWASNLKTLENFYIQHLVPHILNNP